MAFQITQCPSCNSTFNTSPQMLEMAAGKVRCGACLYVFQAREHFVDVDSDEADESVFIGNDPEDFFDPAVFLTRSALQDDQTSSGQQDLISTAANADPDRLTEPDTELGEHEEPERQHPDSEPSISASQTIAEGQIKDSMAAEPISENEIWAETDAEVAAQVNSESNTDAQIAGETAAETEAEHAEFFAALEESLDELEATDETEEPKAIAELDAFGSVSEAATTAQFEASTAFQTQAETRAEPRPGDAHAEQTAVELPASDDSDIEQNTSTEPAPFPAPESTAPASTQRPEDVSLSTSFSVQPRPAVLSAKTAAAAGAETQGQRDHAEQLDTNRDRPASDSDLAEMDSEATIANETQADIGLGKENQDAVIKDNPSIDELPLENELPSAIDEAAAEPAFSEPELDATTEFSEKTSVLKPYNIRAAELAEQDFNEAIKEQDFADTVASGFAAEESMDSELDSSIDWQLASVEGESDDLHTSESEDDEQNQDSASEEETEVSSEDIRARAMRAQLRDDEALEQLPEENLAALKVMATPLELGSVQGRRWGATLGLSLLACSLGTGMAAQFLWRHNAVFSQEPMLRPLFASACQILGCGLEPYSNLSAIVSSNLSVRSHPERADAIMVNIEMRNTAPFEQPFPIMVLGFNTASNDLVALREFKPEEYLDSGLRDITQMPVMAPVQIDLALMDPGNDAVNYTLAFRQP